MNIGSGGGGLIFFFFFFLSLLLFLTFMPACISHCLPLDAIDCVYLCIQLPLDCFSMGSDHYSQLSFEYLNMNIERFKNSILTKQTHLCTTDQEQLKRPWLDDIFHPEFNFKTRGAVILIYIKVHFVPFGTLCDSHWHYIIVTGCLYRTPVVLVSVCAPYCDNIDSMRTLIITS